MIRNLVIDNRSYRSFDESKISKDELTDLIETARLCPSAANRQPLKYRLVYEHDEVEEVLALTHWAGLLKDMKFPPDGHHPQAFIAVCCDTSIAEDAGYTRFDAGIASQTILLAAAEEGYGGCMLGAFDPEEVSLCLRLPKKLKPIVLIALGVPDECVILCNVPESGSTAYFRDKANVHYVPKRGLDEIIVE